jgi:hypothetical protein
MGYSQQKVDQESWTGRCFGNDIRKSYDDMITTCKGSKSDPGRFLSSVQMRFSNPPRDVVRASHPISFTCFFQVLATSPMVVAGAWFATIPELIRAAWQPERDCVQGSLTHSILSFELSLTLGPGLGRTKNVPDGPHDADSRPTIALSTELINALCIYNRARAPYFSPRLEPHLGRVGRRCPAHSQPHSAQ